MKLLFMLLLAFPFAVNAQNLGREFTWLKIAPTEYSVKSKKPVYNVDVTLQSEAFTKDQLRENASFYFRNVFNSEFVKEVGKNTMTGVGTYTLNLAKENITGAYTVSYVMEITWKEGKFSMEMHDFVVEHLNTNVNIGNRIELAQHNDPAATTLLKYFNAFNLVELKRAYDAMSCIPLDLQATASR